ncbi:MAG: hypothetical protein IJX14_11305, partial [Clostridia bacterium]|nr:hypothetical protein [Clostridia bacterium]
VFILMFKWTHLLLLVLYHGSSVLDQIDRPISFNTFFCCSSFIYFVFSAKSASNISAIMTAIKILTRNFPYDILNSQHSATGCTLGGDYT